MRKKIGELLIESGAVTEEQVRKALGQQRAFGKGQKLGAVLVSLGFASPAAVARALARQFDLPFVELPEIPRAVLNLIPLNFQTRNRVIPFRLEVEGRNERLHLAVEDPADLSVVDQLRFQLGKAIRVYVAAPDDIERALAEARGEPEEIGDEAIALEDAPVEGEMELERSASMVMGSWVGEAPASSKPPPPPASSLLDELEAATPLDDDEDITIIAPKGTLKSPAKAAKAPPAPASTPPPPPKDSEEVLDDLLGGAAPPKPSGPPKPRVPVVMFGGAAKGVEPPEAPEPPDITEEDLKVLENIERLADGEEATLETEKVKPARMVASLIRLLIRKRVIREEEFLEELSRK
jgi:hypothetical protein